MKAWFVWCGDDWGDYVHGDTQAQAKSMFMMSWGGIECEWIYLRTIRSPRLDNRPITEENILEIYNDDDYYIDSWHPICECEICRV